MAPLQISRPLKCKAVNFTFSVFCVPSDMWFLCLTQIAEDGRRAIYLEMTNGSSAKSSAVSLWENYPDCLAVLNVLSDLSFLCSTQIAEDGRGATDRINGSSAKSLLIINVRDIYEQIWLYAIEEKSSCDIKSRGIGNNIDFLITSTTNSHLTFRRKRWQLNVYRKLNSPSMSEIPIDPDYPICGRAFSLISSYEMNEKSVSKVPKIVNISRCRKKKLWSFRTTFDIRTW